MRFRYSVLKDKEKVTVEQGILLSKKLEEALDGGKMKVILSDESKPFKQYSFISFNAYEVDKNENVIDKIYDEYLVISDEVEKNSKYSYYEHNLTLLEYSSKFDVYLMGAFSYSKNINKIKKAPFEFVSTVPEIEVLDGVQYKKDRLIEEVGSYSIRFDKNISIPTLDIFENNTQNITLKKVDKGYRGGMLMSNTQYVRVPVDVFVRTNAPIPNNEQILSDNDVNWEFPVGEWTITLGFIQSGNAYDYITYYINVENEKTDTLYDVVMNIRDLISKYGGIESKLYFSQTRLFNLNEDDAEYLKTIPTPQIFMPAATLRQLLTFVLSYVNALPRVIKTQNYDELIVEYYGLNSGDYQLKNITEIYSEQNTNQIGTRSYAELKNILPNDLNEATTYSPYQDGNQTVRSTGIQLTEDNFELVLPQDKPLYKPTKFEISIPYHLTQRINPSTGSGEFVSVESGYKTIDITDLLINTSEWKLKEITTNFPNAYYTRAFNRSIGLAMYKNENFEWKQGDTSIKMSNISGTVFKSSLLESVLKYALNKLVTVEIQPTLTGDYTSEYILGFDGVFVGSMWFKNILFNIEYITNESLNIKQDKEDLEEIDFYSEIRHNQSENTINLEMASAKIYGDLQRTGNRHNTFTKYHKSLSDLYKVGLKDIHDNTITNAQYKFFNDYIVGNYTVTRHYNRISQATFIDQTYRWRDNYASELTNRSEAYNDYIFLIPKDMNIDKYGERKINNNLTKIVTKEMYPQDNNVPYIYKVLFGNLGVRHEVERTKATVGLIRTNGTVEGMPDVIVGEQREWNLISVPVSSAGFKGGLVFKIGFKDNQVAGDGLVNIDGKWYNQAIKYTDKNARIKYFDFYILNTVPSQSNKDYYPKYVSTTSLTNTPTFLTNNVVATNDNVVYFSTGNPRFNDTADDSLIVNKDPMSNLNINYSLNIMSYYYGLFVMGREFYSSNQLVKNNDNKKTYLYLYDNGTKYNLFEDLSIKSGYYKKVDIKTNNSVIIKLEDDIVILQVLGIDINDTSWAIGDENGKLILASNENISEIEIVRTHIRPNVKVIGELSVKTIIQTDLSNEIGIIDYSIYSELIRVENELSVIDKSYIGVKYRSTMESEISIVEQVISSEVIRVENEILATTNSVIGLDIQSNLYSNLNVLEYLIEPELIRVDNNFVISNHIFIKDKFTSVLQNEIEILEQNIISELIRVDNVALPINLVKVPTKTPTVSAIYCKLQSGRNNIFVDVTNNDENRVYLHKNGSIFGILEIGQTRSVFIQESNSLPNYFTVDIYVIDVNGNKLKSNTVTKSGTITYCLP